MQTDPIASTVRVADASGGRGRRGSAADDAGSFASMISVAANESPAKPDVPTAATGSRDEASSENEETRRRNGAADRDTDEIGSADTGPQARATSSDAFAAAASAASPVVPPAEASADAPPSPPQAASAIAGSSLGPSASPSSGTASTPATLSALSTSPAAERPAGNGAAASPPSAQAADLTRVLAAGTRVQVVRAADGSGLGAPSLAGDSIVALAAGEEAPPAAGRGPTARTLGSTATAPMMVTGDGEASTAAASAPLVLDAGAAMKGGSRKEVSASPSKQSDGDPRGSAGNALVPNATAAAAASTISSTAGVAAPATATGGSAAAVTAGGKGAAQTTTGEALAAKPETVRIQDNRAAATLQVQVQPQVPATAATLHPGPAVSDRAAAGDTTPHPAASQVSVHIAKAVQAGLDRIEIQLAPASLGCVEVRLDIVDRHHVTIAVSADSPDALDALRTDSRLLERALQDAGLKTDAGSLGFHLRDHGARSGQGGGSSGGDDFNAHRDRSAAANEAPPVMPAPPIPGRTGGGIDIHA